MKMKSILPVATIALLGMQMAASAALITTDTNLVNWAPGGFVTCTPDGETTASDLKQSRVDYQSFTLTSGISAVTEIQFGGIFLANTGAATFNVAIYKLDQGVGPLDPTYASNLGAQVFTLNVANTQSPGATSGFGFVSIALDAGEQFSMPAGDYAMEWIADSSANAWVKLDLGNDGSHSGAFYTGGLANVRGDTTGNYDVPLAVIPEPATFSLIGVIGGALLFIRRRFMM